MSAGGPSPWGQKPQRSRFGIRLLALVGLFGAIVIALLWASPPTLIDAGEQRLVYLVLLGLFVLVGAAASRRKLTSIARDVAMWVAILLAVVAAYGFRFELQELGDRVAAELLPSQAKVVNGDTVVLTRAVDDHFWVDARVDGKTVRFLVDTGASAIVLTRKDAARLGFAVQDLAFTKIFETANGVTRGARVQLDEIRVGPIAFNGVTAWVNEGDLRQSLLGMGFLDRLGSVEIRGNTLTIRR